MNLTSQQEKLALEIAHKLKDMKSIEWHRKMVSMYSESYLREQLQNALTLPDEKVKVYIGVEVLPVIVFITFSLFARKYGLTNQVGSVDE